MSADDDDSGDGRKVAPARSSEGLTYFVDNPRGCRLGVDMDRCGNLQVGIPVRARRYLTWSSRTSLESQLVKIEGVWNHSSELCE